MNIISDTFLQTYNNFSVYYINRKGYRRYQITCNEAVGCSKIRKLIDASRFQRQYPTEVGYSYAMTTTFYFAIRSSETVAMGALAALKYWHEQVNVGMPLCSEEELNNIAKSILVRWCRLLFISDNVY